MMNFQKGGEGGLAPILPADVAVAVAIPGSSISRAGVAHMMEQCLSELSQHNWVPPVNLHFL